MGMKAPTVQACRVSKSPRTKREGREEPWDHFPSSFPNAHKQYLKMQRLNSLPRNAILLLHALYLTHGPSNT
ncbi:hypothetical protein HanPI659440_Chr14g0573681 [Helianthus annuus]|nr:hypothetical protein HanPI659440_Chr14g0573681 [Helianthus annuus]